MTKAKISEYDAVASNNTDVNGVNIAEGCPPSGMNNMGREIMAALKRFQVGSDGDGVTVGGNLVVSGSSTVNTFTAGPVSATTLNTSGAVVFNDAGADVDFRVEGDTDANLLFVDASADAVGIGTNAPSYRLSVSKASAGDVAQFTNGGASNKSLFVYTDATYAAIATGTSASGNGIAFDATNNAILFTTASQNRATIDSSGNVGIGTSSPSTPLDVQANSSALGIRVRGRAAGDGGNIAFFSNNNATEQLSIFSSSSENAFFGTGSRYMSFSTNGSERMRIDSSGNLLVGTTSGYGSGKIQYEGTNSDGISGKLLGSTGACFVANVNNTAQQLAYFIYQDSTEVGKITTNGTSTTYATSSDYRLKENVAPMTGALAKVLELNPVTYNWKTDGSEGHGFIAHELQAVVPDAVVGEKDATEIRQVEVSPAVEATYDDEGNELTPAVEAVYEEREVPVYQGVDTSFLVATLTAAIQELSAKNDALEARIAALENA